MAAIYCPTWPKEVTTTLYPVDVTETIVFGISLTAGSMDVPLSEYITANMDFVSGYHYQARWFYEDGPYDDTITGTFDFISGYHYQARWFYDDGPYDDSITGNFNLVNGYYLNKLVKADTPDEELQLTCVINNSCTMTGI